MKNNTIEDIKEYAKDSQTKQEPTEQNYAEGVKVGWTLPAKWWNWLMNAFTKRFRETKATVDSMYEELSNLMWPLVPGENETNDQCKRRVYGRMSELSEQIDTNTGNISANASAINIEKLARQTAIEQEQTARTQQDNVLDDKIVNLHLTVSANIEQEQNARTQQDNILDSKITDLSSTVSANTSDITKNSRKIASTKDYLTRVKNSVEMHPFDFGAGTDIHTIDIPLDPSGATFGTEVRTPIHFIYSMHNNYNNIVVRLINNKDSWYSGDTVKLYISYEGLMRDSNLDKDVSFQEMSRYFVRLGDCERTTDGKFIISKLTLNKVVAVKITINQYSYWKLNSD